MSECKICKGFIGLNICLKCGLKQGAIAELKDELDWLNRSLVVRYDYCRKCNKRYSYDSGASCCGRKVVSWDEYNVYLGNMLEGTK